MPKLAAIAKARFPCHHALKYRTFLATPIATVLAIDVAAYSDTALEMVSVVC